MGRDRSYKLHDSYCKSPYEQAIDGAISASRASHVEKPKPKKPEKKPFVPADPRCKECFYWRYLGCFNEGSCNCCHFALLEGKLRDQISKTECGSFKDKNSEPSRKIEFSSVPMSQWGTGGLATIRRGER